MKVNVLLHFFYQTEFQWFLTGLIDNGLIIQNRDSADCWK